MIRRRRRTREIPFGLDSFLDIIANVVGIIIRMILVVWVGARSYHALMVPSAEKEEPLPPVAVAPLDPLPPPTDPLEQELQRQQRDLDQARQQLLEQLRQLPALEGQRQSLQQQLAMLQQELHQLRTHRQQRLHQVTGQGQDSQQVEASLVELRQRSRKLREEITTLQKQPVARKALHYRTPVSRPVEADELLFECRRGKVSFIDVEAMLAEVKAGLREKGEMLRKQWQVQDVTAPVGPFRLRYVVARLKDGMDGIMTALQPDAESNFRYGVEEWEVEPLSAERGEDLTQALQPGSHFRQITDALLPRQTVVTFFVYPDSFALFRQLRDHLYQRDIEVAGRPLPDDRPIRASRRGIRSMGQ